jgi:hypothetical protein
MINEFIHLNGFQIKGAKNGLYVSELQSSGSSQNYTIFWLPPFHVKASIRSAFLWRPALTRASLVLRDDYYGLYPNKSTT